MDTPQDDNERYLTTRRFGDFETRLWERFDRNDNLSRTLGERVAVVEAIANKNEYRLDNHATETKKTAASWGAGVGTAAAAFAYAIFSFVTGHKQ